MANGGCVFLDDGIENESLEDMVYRVYRHIDNLGEGIKTISNLPLKNLLEEVRWILELLTLFQAADRDVIGRSREECEEILARHKAIGLPTGLSEGREDSE